MNHRRGLKITEPNLLPRIAGALMKPFNSVQGKQKISESDFLNTIIEYAQLRGWLCAHFRSVKVQRQDGSVYYQTPVQAEGKGYPDLCLVRGDRLVFAEVKAISGRVSQEQKEWLEALTHTGKCEVYVWQPNDWDKVEDILK